MWILAGVAVVLLGLAALVAAGRFGEMPELVDDRPTPRIPEGDFTTADIAGLKFARVPRGYARHQVDALLRKISKALGPEGSAVSLDADTVRFSRFSVVGSGYQMGQVDIVLERLARQLESQSRAELSPTNDEPAAETQPSTGEPVAVSDQDAE